MGYINFIGSTDYGAVISTTNTVQMLFQKDSTVCGFYMHDTLSASKQFDFSSYDDNQSHYISLIVDENAESFKLYIDGQLKSLNNASSATSTGYNTLTIGSQFSGARYFNGILDQFRIFDKALSPEEVQTIYNLEK